MKVACRESNTVKENEKNAVRVNSNISECINECNLANMKTGTTTK